MSILAHIKEHRQDAFKWQVNRWLTAAADDMYLRTAAVDKVVILLSKITNPMIQQAYSDFITSTKSFKISKKVLNDVLSNTAEHIAKDKDEEDNLDKLPAWMNREEVEMKGYCAVKQKDRVGYFGWGGNNKVEISNFLIHPIFHVKGEADDSRHIFEVENRVKRVLMDVPSKVFISLETLQTHLVAKGNYLFFGSKPQLLRIANEILPQFPLCDEIKQLGWQPEGFFAYVNKVFIPSNEWKTISSFGIFDINDQYFLIPAASKLYADLRSGEDLFQQVKPLTFLPAKITFSDWANQMNKVYGDKGLTGVAFALATCFRDYLFKINTNFPHLYGYGERSSGKSQWASSVSAIFYKQRPAFNLNSGTDFAFFAYMQSFRNCPAHLNEFDDKVVREEWFQAIKGIFDGEGRMRGKMGNRNHIEIQHVESALILTGQYISTKDDNSVVSRSIVEAFAEKQFTDEEKAEFDKLRQWQEEGITSLVSDIVAHREMVVKNYYQAYNDILMQWRKMTHGEFNQRIFQNWAHLATMWYLLKEPLNLPVPFAEFTEMAYKKAMAYSKFIRSSDTLTDFWNTVAFLLDQDHIVTGWDFKIKYTTEIILRNSDGNVYTEKYSEPRKLLYLRLNNVHKLYQQAKSKTGNKDSMTLENLKHYFSSRPYYIGQCKQEQFKRLIFKPIEKTQHGVHGTPDLTTISTTGQPETVITSAFIFDYEMLGCELERNYSPENMPDNETNNS
jgi:hypothetical protein